jgi:hypothetical protein
LKGYNTSCAVVKEREEQLGSRTSSHVWREGDKWVRHKWRLQLSQPPFALTLGLSQSDTEQLKNLDAMARMMLMHEMWENTKL